MITSILDGSINKVKFIKEKYFGLMIPLELKNVDKNILNPQSSWLDKNAYDFEARALSEKFKNNFKLYGKELDHLLTSGPII